MSRDIEDRLRQALEARAEQVTQQSLRPAEPPESRRRAVDEAIRLVRRPWVGAAVGAAAASAAAIMAFAVVDGGDSNQVADPTPTPTVSTEPTSPAVHPGSDCPRESLLVTTALEKAPLRQADVDGDGAPDSIAVVADAQAAPPACRAFVGVLTATGIYSTALGTPTTVPEGMSPEIVALPDLGDDGDAEIVVDTRARADGQLAQLFTFTDDGLAWVPSPAFEDGTFYVEGAGLTEPRGADCTPEGELILSMGLAVDQGRQYEVTRHVYPATGDPLELGDPAMVSRTVPADALFEQFPELESGPHHFDACS
jgi:hypothetical protein